MSYERWAIVLEGVSFFLVTIDLYGRERLLALEVRINTWVQRRLPFLGNVVDRIDGSSILGGFLLLSFIGIGFYLDSKHPEWRLFVHRDEMGMTDSSDDGTYGKLYAIWIAFFLVGIPSIAVGLYMLLQLVLVFLRKFRMEGFFLFTGAVLFICSKTISFVRTP